MGHGIGVNVDRIVGVLKEYAGCGLTFIDLMTISGLSHMTVIKVFDELEDNDSLMIKSDGLSRIYSFRE